MKMTTTVVNTQMWHDEHVDPVVVTQHTEGASEVEERNNYRIVSMMEENGRKQK
jgi:hypothetical protein